MGVLPNSAPPKTRTRTSVVVLIVVSALIIGGVAAGAGAFWSYGNRTGPATTSDSNGDVVATAGNSSISARELQEAVMHLQHMKQMAERELQGLGEDMGQPTDYLESRHNLVLKWGDDNAALAGLIHERIMYQKAVELGYDATEEELAENIEWARESYERGQWDSYNQGYVESVGEEHYWESIYPVLLARSMAIQKLYEGLAKEVGTRYYDGESPLRYTFEEAVLAEADITVLESEEHSATLDGIVGFMEDVRETNIAHLRRLD
ncbi:MAG: hypothetical protein F4W95_10520 [Chloroflexi bacterium]|nr:hypothetical protein [Chloroflexota bacterium]MYD48906.1 hypothetical protein [Chloroflexota bacterium]